MDLRRFRVQLQPRKHGKKLQTSYKGYMRVEKMLLQTLRGEFESLQMRKAESIFLLFSLLEKWATMTENICHPTLFMTEFLSVIVAPLTNL